MIFINTSVMNKSTIFLKFDTSKEEPYFEMFYVKHLFSLKISMK